MAASPKPFARGPGLRLQSRPRSVRSTIAANSAVAKTIIGEPKIGAALRDGPLRQHRRDAYRKYNAADRIEMRVHRRPL